MKTMYLKRNGSPKGKRKEIYKYFFINYVIIVAYLKI
jgi:hypothetical protein